MSKANAYEFVLNYVYRDNDVEAQLKLTPNHEELLKLIVQIAQDEGWPTGVFDENNLKEMYTDHARNHRDPTLFVPPNDETVTRLFRAGTIGGSANRW